MFIGASRQCKEYCKQSSKGLYQSEHARHKHIILDLKSFKEENKDYILRIQKAWQHFDKDLQSFFNALRKEIDLIENEAQSRLLDQQLKTAVNSNDKKLIELSRTIFNEKFDKLTCREIDDFLDIKQRQENSRGFLKIQRRQEEFAYDIIDDIKKAAYSIGKRLTDTMGRELEREKQQKLRKEPQQSKRSEPRNEGRRDNKDRQEVRRDRPEPRNKDSANYKEEKGYREDRNEKRENRHNKQRQYEKKGNKRNEDTLKEQQMQSRQDRREKQGIRDNRRKQNDPQRQAYRERGGKGSRHNQKKQQQRPKDKTNQGPSKANKTYKKVQIKDLTKESDQFSIDVKFIAYIKSLRDRDVWRVGDASGEIKLVIPPHELFKSGVSVTLDNCFVRAHGSELQVVAKLFSTVYFPELGKKVDVGSLLKGNPEKARQNKQGPARTYKTFTKIADIEPGLQNLKIIAKVISVTANKNSFQCVLGDETGIINARLNSGSQFLKPNNTVYLRDVDADISGETEGTMVIVSGERFSIQTAREHIKKVREDNNLSLRVYQAYDDQ